jgi:hypothetical protein
MTMRLKLVSFAASFPLVVGALSALAACHSDQPPNTSNTPAVTPESDTTRTTSGSWDTPDLGPATELARPDAGVF